MRPPLPALICAALCAGAAPAVAAPGDDIGATVRIVNLVTGAYAKDLRHLAKGDSVRQDELIEVSADGIGEIRLRDDTELALGPGARLKLDQFVYDPDISGGAIVVDLVRGAFRFITGLAAKPAYVIRTPTASITVRGTIFDVYVQESAQEIGRSWLLLIDGAVEICNARGECGLHDEPGKLIEITPDGGIGTPVTWAALETDGLPFETAFPFVVTPPEVDPDPKFTADDIVSGDVPGAPSDTDDDGGRDDDGVIDEPDIDDGPAPGPLTCWQGWKQVSKGFDEPGWRVKKKRRGSRAIWCAHPVAPLPPGPGLPPKPTCIGGKVVALMMLPPKWSCVCPAGKKRHKIGKNAYLCKGKPDGGNDKNPKKECLGKGWKWTGKLCLPPLGKCPKGTIGKWPNCKKLEIKPKKCPQGFIGTPPNCKKLVLKKPEPKQPDKKIQDLPKAIKKFQLQKKD